MNIVTTKELSAVLKVKAKTIYAWAELGVVPSIKMNGALRFDLEDIQRWLKDCKKGPGSGYNSIQGRGPRKGGL
ncbi:MAG: helix-turn-helix domain-containing protein [Dissulfurispiraceae bacterium]